MRTALLSLAAKFLADLAHQCWVGVSREIFYAIEVHGAGGSWCSHVWFKYGGMGTAETGRSPLAGSRPPRQPHELRKFNFRLLSRRSQRQPASHNATQLHAWNTAYGTIHYATSFLTKSSSRQPATCWNSSIQSSALHPGFRPAHAKGLMLTGTFTPSSEAASLTKAPHTGRESTPVTVRFSNSTGIPLLPDNDPNGNPRGLAIRFHLAEHSHTDIVSHSTDGFPTRTGQEFLEFLRAVAATGASKSSPSPVEIFLGSHPKALAFVQTPNLPLRALRKNDISVSRPCDLRTARA